MTTNEQMKRLEALEREARLRRMEAELDTPPPDVVAMAERYDPDFVIYKETMREAYQRVEEVGEEAYLAETAAELGTTVQELRSGEFTARRERERARWEETDVIVWHGGTPPIPYRNGEIVRDANGEPLKFR